MKTCKEKNLRLAIIGCSNLVYEFIYDCAKKFPFELVAVSDTPDNMDIFAKKYATPSKYVDYKEMLDKENVDLVISFPEGKKQFDIAKDCLLAGADVYSERPTVYSTDDAYELAELEKKTGHSIILRLNRRFTPAYVMAKDILQKEEFGKPTMYLAKYHGSACQSEDSFIWNHAIHHLDLARFLLGELTLTYVDRAFVDEHKLGYNISFRSENGCAGVIQTSALQCVEYPVERIEITGNARNLMVEDIRKIEYSRPVPPRTTINRMKLEDNVDTLSWNPSSAQLNNFTFFGLENCFEHIANSLLEEKQIFPNMSDTLKTIQLVEKLQEMVNQKRA